MSGRFDSQLLDLPTSLDCGDFIPSSIMQTEWQEQGLTSAQMGSLLSAAISCGSPALQWEVPGCWSPASDR